MVISEHAKKAVAKLLKTVRDNQPNGKPWEEIVQEAIDKALRKEKPH